MIGVIVTGHGTFASGMLSAVRLLAGETGQLQAVDFLPDECEEDLRAHLEQVLDGMREYHHVYILCDILGGSPFKMAYLLRRNRTDIDILYGANLPMLLDISMEVMSGTDSAGLEERAGKMLADGREHMGMV